MLSLSSIFYRVKEESVAYVTHKDESSVFKWTDAGKVVSYNNMSSRKPRSTRLLGIIWLTKLSLAYRPCTSTTMTLQDFHKWLGKDVAVIYFHFHEPGEAL